MLLAVLVIVLISYNPPLVLFGGFMVYAVSGPVLTLWRLRQRRAERKAQHDAAGKNNGDDLENP
jgi:CDP-diacylglycerol--serine O-phosphatidyltransferase